MGVKIYAALVSITLLVSKCHGWNTHYNYDYGSPADSDYIHSNDTMTLTIVDNTMLRGAVGTSHHVLEFVLHNRGSPGHFSISGSSEDNFVGRLQEKEAYLNNNGMTTIRVTDLVVPNRPAGAKVTYTLNVIRDSSNFNNFRKRAAEPEQAPAQSMGGSGYNSGGGSGGSFNNGGGSHGSYVPPGNQGGQGGSFNNGGSQGGQGGAFNHGGSHGNSGGSFDNHGQDSYRPPGGSGGSGGSFNNGGSQGNSGGSFNNDGQGSYRPPGGSGGSGGSFNNGGSQGNSGGSFNNNGQDSYRPPGGSGGSGGSFNSGGSGGSFNGERTDGNSRNRYSKSRNGRPDYRSGSTGYGAESSVILIGVSFSYFMNVIFGAHSSKHTACRIFQSLFWTLSLLQYSQGQDGSRGSGGQIGGSGGNMGGGGGGFYPNPNDRIPDNRWDDPSNRRQVSLTVEFTVAEPDDVDDRESSEPWITSEYFATSQSETCHNSQSDKHDLYMTNCKDQWWWVKFTTADTNSGLVSIDMDKSKETSGNGRPDWDRHPEDVVYYRYKKFAVGTDDEVEIVGGASCCQEHMRLVVTDVDGNKAEEIAYNNHYGGGWPGGLSTAAFWGIVGGAIALVLIIVLVIVIVCVKKYKGYSGVNTG